MGLVYVLELFEWVSDDLQGNKVSISIVLYLKSNLVSDIDSYRYKHDLRNHLLESLNKLLLPLFEKDPVYIISTFLDHNFGLDSFPADIKDKVRKNVRKVLVMSESNELNIACKIFAAKR